MAVIKKKVEVDIQVDFFRRHETDRTNKGRLIIIVTHILVFVGTMIGPSERF
jgi:hypothetical protein